MNVPTWDNAGEPEATSAGGQFKPAKSQIPLVPATEFTLGKYMRTVVEKEKERERGPETARRLIKSIWWEREIV